jgi:hypothetical protein
MKRTEMKSPHPTGARKTESIPVPNDGGAEQKCFTCGKGGVAVWFCRLPHNGVRIVLCSPSCAMRFFESSYPAHGAHKI